MPKITDFTIQKKLGEGSFSQVFQVMRNSDSKVYAMKKVKMQKLSAKERENALNEVRILASINHPNVIGYKEAFFEDATNSLCVVMENADGGDVLQLISEKKKRREQVSEKTIWHYFIQIVRGLKALHDLKICHRDIKCANIFLTKEGVVKLGDLNVSKVAKRGMLRTQTGTPYYACPEVWKDQPYDHRSDIWSLGCVLYEMITQMPPFRAATMKGLYTKVISGKYDPIPSTYSKDLQNVLKACLQVRSSDRHDCDQLLRMPGLKNHVTDKLDDIESRKQETESLLNTIRMPRNLGMITERMPAANYAKPEERLHSAANLQRNVAEVEKVPQKRAVSSHSNNDEKLPRHLATPTSSQSSKVPSESTDVTQQQLKLKKLIDPAALDIIEEKADDQGTGMDNIKVLLKDRKQRVEPVSVEKKVVPNSVDILQKKLEANRDISSKIVQRVKELQEMKQPSLPQISSASRHRVVQSVDSLPLLSNRAAPVRNVESAHQRQDLVNIRYNNRVGNHHERQPSRQSNESENQPEGFRAMLRRHLDSRSSHVDRIRRQNQMHSADYRAAGQEEVMRLKNELAMQRAQRLQNKQQGYRPSVAALNNYAPLKQEMPIAVPNSARAVVSSKALQELRQILL